MKYFHQKQSPNKFQKDREALKRLEKHPQVKVASFNLMNLALPGKDYYPKQRYSRQSYEDKISWTKDQLVKMDADIVGFQEVFHKKALEDAVKASGKYAGAFLELADECANLPRVALLSRFPVLAFTAIKDFPEEARISMEGSILGSGEFSRPVLKARLNFPGNKEVVVLVAHLKSKRPMIPEGYDPHDPWQETAGSVRSLVQRSCEAAALRYLILEEIQNSDTPLILMGDLNDASHAVTSELLQGNQAQKRYPDEVKAKLWDIFLYSCQDIQIRRSYKDVYYTHLHNSHYESLDHILVSQEFVNENPKHLGWVEYLRLYNDHLLDPALGEEDLPRYVSDHAQILVSLRMRNSS